jgi:hypothetical protein
MDKEMHCGERDLQCRRSSHTALLRDTGCGTGAVINTRRCSLRPCSASPGNSLREGEYNNQQKDDQTQSKLQEEHKRAAIGGPGRAPPPEHVNSRESPSSHR